MPQEFHVLQCFQCHTFQVHQVKKTNKWNCKLCGVKQSVIKVFGRGSGADCRHHVQRLNQLRGVQEVARHQIYKDCEQQVQNADYNDDMEMEKDFDNVSMESHLDSTSNKWSRYMEPETEGQHSENEEDGDDLYTTNKTEFMAVNKHNRKSKKRKQPYDPSNQRSFTKRKYGTTVNEEKFQADMYTLENNNLTNTHSRFSNQVKTNCQGHSGRGQISGGSLGPKWGQIVESRESSSSQEENQNLSTKFQNNIRVCEQNQKYIDLNVKSDCADKIIGASERLNNFENVQKYSKWGHFTEDKSDTDSEYSEEILKNNRPNCDVDQFSKENTNVTDVYSKNSLEVRKSSKWGQFLEDESESSSEDEEIPENLISKFSRNGIQKDVIGSSDRDFEQNSSILNSQNNGFHGDQCSDDKCWDQLNNPTDAFFKTDFTIQNTSRIVDPSYDKENKKQQNVHCCERTENLKIFKNDGTNVQNKITKTQNLSVNTGLFNTGDINEDDLDLDF